MQEVRLAGAAPYPLMGLFGEEKGSFYKIPILLFLANLLTRLGKFIPRLLDEDFILCSIIHRLYF
jgi:hypothetical protein